MIWLHNFQYADIVSGAFPAVGTLLAALIVRWFYNGLKVHMRFRKMKSQGIVRYLSVSKLGSLIPGHSSHCGQQDAADYDVVAHHATLAPPGTSSRHFKIPSS